MLRSRPPSSPSFGCVLRFRPPSVTHILSFHSSIFLISSNQQSSAILRVRATSPMSSGLAPLASCFALAPPPSRTSNHFIHLFSELAIFISLPLPFGCAPPPPCRPAAAGQLRRRLSYGLPARLLVEVGFRAPKKLAGFTILQLAFVFCSARGVQRNLASSEVIRRITWGRCHAGLRIAGSYPFSSSMEKRRR